MFINKRRSRVLALGLVVILLLCNMIPVFASEYNADRDEEYSTIMQDQSGAVNTDIQFLSSIEKNEEGEYIFPSQYGGRFVKGNKLYICLTDLSEEVCAPIEKALKGYEMYYQFISVDFSYNELLDVCMNIVDYLAKQNVKVVERSISQRENKVYIGVNEDDFFNAKQLVLDRAAKSEKKNMPQVELEIIAETPVEETTLYGGSTIYNSNAGAFTAGVCGTFRGSPAIIACAHGGQNIGNTIRYQNASGAIIGEVSYFNYSNGGTGDFEIITITNESFDISGWIKNTYRVYGVYPSPAEGVRLIKYGRASNSYATVVVDREDVTIIHTQSGYTIHGVTRCELISGSSEGGDSGGPYFLNYNGNVLFGGIHSSHLVTEDNNGNAVDYVYFTPWEYASNSGFTVKMG